MAKKLRKEQMDFGGTPSQFVKGDASLDDTIYATATQLDNKVTKTGDTMSGPLVFNSNSTSILKKDMSIYPGTTGFARDMFQLIDSTGIKDSFGWFGNVAAGVVTLTYGYLGGTTYNAKSAIRWTPDGRVGIGLSSTSVPLSGYALHTAGNTYTVGNIDLTGSISTVGTELNLQRAGVTRFRSSGLNTVLASEGSGQIYLRPQGDAVTTNQVVIDSLGNIITTNYGTSQAWNGAVTTLNIVPRQGATGGTIGSVRSLDTRNVNSFPSTDLANGIWFDFKTSSVIGLTGANIFSAVITMVPYTDNSGNIGTAFRLAQSADEMYFQNYASAGTWGSFRKFWTDKHFSQANITSWNNTASQLGNYIPLSQKGIANGVATLDAAAQIPNAQIPQRLTNKVLAIGGEIGDTSFTGLYDRNQLALADKENTVTSIINGAGTFSGGMAAFNNTIFNSKSDFATLTGTDATTEVVITITFSSVLSNYGRGYWQPFIQTRLNVGQQFRDVTVEVMDSSNVWYSPAAFNVQNMVLIPNSGLFLFPEGSFGTASIKAVRFKLSNVLTSNGIAYVSNIGFRHVSHSFAPQFPHRGENNQFYGINTFNASPRVPNATVADQAVNFGQIIGQIPNNPTALLTLDLNTIITPGFFNQTADANATVARNYPIQRAGYLNVFKTTGNAVVQEYTSYLNEGTYKRYYSGTNWNGWKKVLTDIDTIPQLASYVTQSSLITQLGNYATLNGVQTFSNTITFSQSPIVPNATLIPHAVNLGQMTDYVDVNVGSVLNQVTNNFQTLNTEQSVGATKSYTSPFPFKFKTAGTKTWVLHKPNGNSFIFAPSTVVDSENWDWANQISFDEDGSVTANKLKVRGGLSTQFMKADGSLDSNTYVTTDTPQSITGYKTFEAGAELLLKGDDQNLIQSFKSSNNYGGHLVAGWYYRHYSAIWQTGIIRGAGALSEGFGFDLSENGGSTFNRIFKIQADGNLVTNNFGSADQWNEAYLRGLKAIERIGVSMYNRNVISYGSWNTVVPEFLVINFPEVNNNGWMYDFDIKITDLSTGISNRKEDNVLNINFNGIIYPNMIQGDVKKLNGNSLKISTVKLYRNSGGLPCIVITKPQGSLSVYKVEVSDIRSFGNYDNTHDPDIYTKFEVLNRNDINGFVEEFDYTEEVTYEFQGKKITLLGDSITWGWDNGNQTTYYPDYIKEKFKGAEVGVNGFSGGTLASDPAWNIHILSHSNIDAIIAHAPDILIIMGGVNDYQTGMNIGGMGALPTSTIGSLEEALIKIRQSLPNCRVLFCTSGAYYYRPNGMPNIQSGREVNSIGYTLSQYFNACIDLCRQYSVETLNFYEDCGWFDENETTGNYNFTIDGLHFSKKAYDRLTDRQFKKLTRGY